MLLLRDLLKKGTRVHFINDADFYYYGGVICDTISGSYIVTGQKYSANEFDQKEGKIAISPKLSCIYLCEIDSSGEINSSNEFKFTVAEPKGYVNKIPANYLLRIVDFKKEKDGGYALETDAFKATGNQLCYSFCNSSIIRLSEVDGNITAEKYNPGTNILIEKFLQSNDKTDMNGRVCADSISEMEKLSYKKISMQVKLGYKLDGNNNPIWLLKKSETAKANENYSVLAPVKRVYQVTKIADVAKAENPAFILISSDRFLLARQMAADKFSLQLFNW